VFCRYDVATVLTVFQELSHYAADENFNWNELVKKTTTGISTAREYQMLWRHLAYGYSFPEDFDQEAQPMVGIILLCFFFFFLLMFIRDIS
jgi:hypothetical protein